MGIIFIGCEDDLGHKFSKAKCISFNVNFVLDVLLLIVLGYQIFLRIKKTEKFFSRKLAIFYLLLLQILANTLYSGITAWVEAYILDIYFREVCFTYTLFFFARKAWRLSEENKITLKRGTLTVVTMMILYFTGIIIYAMILKNDQNLCKASYWLYLRIAGIIMTFLFIIVAVVVHKRYKSRLKSIFEEDMTLLKITEHSVPLNPEFMQNYAETVLRTDEQLYNLIKIVGFNNLSQVLSLFTLIYLLVGSQDSESCNLYTNPDDPSMTETINMILEWAIRVICFYMPIIVTVLAFWQKNESQYFSNSPNHSMSEEEATHPLYMRNIKFQNQKRSPLTLSIDDEKSLNGSFVSNNMSIHNKDQMKSSHVSVEEMMLNNKISKNSKGNRHNERKRKY